MGKGTEFEGTQEAEGQGQSSQGTSQGEHLETSAQEKQLVASLLQSETASKLISDMVEQGVAKAFQSNKDKRLQQVDENKSEIQRIRELVEGKGLSFDDAEAQIRQENTQAEIQDKLATLLAGEADNAPDKGKLWTEREAAILASSGIDPKDPELKRFFEKFDSPEEYLKALPDKVFEMRKRPGGTEGSASGGQGTFVDEDLESEYKKEFAQIKPGNWRAIATLNKKYRAKGLEVWP